MGLRYYFNYDPYGDGLYGEAAFFRDYCPRVRTITTQWQTQHSISKTQINEIY